MGCSSRRWRHGRREGYGGAEGRALAAMILDPRFQMRAELHTSLARESSDDPETLANRAGQFVPKPVEAVVAAGDRALPLGAQTPRQFEA